METKYKDKTSLGEPTSAVDIMIADYMDPKDFIDPVAARVAPGKIYTFIDGSDTYYVLCSETLVIKVSVNKRFERRTSANKNKTHSTKVTTSDDRYDTSRFRHAEDFYDFSPRKNTIFRFLHSEKPMSYISVTVEGMVMLSIAVPEKA